MIFHPTIAFSGFIGSLIIAIFTGSLLAINPFRLFISKEELNFISSGMKMIRHLYFAIIVTLGSSLYTIVLTSIDKEYEKAWIHKFVTQVVGAATTLYIFFGTVLIISILQIPSVKKLIKNFANKSRLNKNVIILSYLFIWACCIISCTVFHGLFMNETLLNNVKPEMKFNTSSDLLFQIYLYDKEIIFLYLLMLLVIYFIYVLIEKSSKFLLKFEIFINVYCTDGSIYLNKYLVNHNVDGNLLVCDTNNVSDINKYLISKSQIKYIKFITVPYSFGEEIDKLYRRIVLPEDFTEQEKNLDYRNSDHK
ncbi:hypothetical protein J2Z32_002647 [Paenibacillus turicensis]|uniref:DUF5671 domain-containing protein n=1 Tax=Paenibacillus turicensis TaxID=160487 RepID=A0ABS4FUH1_9BACL|nr:hypothetical protein [Paenibacillus turicensis]MBP1905998.1 hypothetical protein [Paenibacillus turicensis]